MQELGTPNYAPVAVIGAGPAGLTAAMELADRGRPVVVLEAGAEIGGLARTVERDGYRFDLGGHRFYTKRPEIEAIWRELLGEDLLVRRRRSRIRWRGRFIEYPLRFGDLIARVGGVELARAGGSYLRARARPHGEAENFEQWVIDRFGRRLYENFFRSYTEKVWGAPTTEISADWAAQRIRELSLAEAIKSAITGADRGHHSLIDEFLYPRLGPGQLWEAMRARIEAGGGEVRTGAPVEELAPPADGAGPAVRAGGEWLASSAVISSAPLSALPGMLGSAGGWLDAARELRHRDFVTVALVIDGPSPFPDNWIYVHDPDVEVGRVQSFGAWSPDMVPRPDRACLGLEYFCFRGDRLWSSPDSELVARARREIDRIGLVPADRVLAGHVIRVPAAYPIYDPGHRSRIAALREALAAFPWLQQIGRNGMHRYNNVDHSMLTAQLAVENLCEGAGHDLWSVNADRTYLEQSEQPLEVQPYLRPPKPAVADRLAPAELQEIA